MHTATFLSDTDDGYQNPKEYLQRLSVWKEQTDEASSLR